MASSNHLASSPAHYGNFQLRVKLSMLGWADIGTVRQRRQQSSLFIGMALVGSTNISLAQLGEYIVLFGDGPRQKVFREKVQVVRCN